MSLLALPDELLSQIADASKLQSVMDDYGQDYEYRINTSSVRSLTSCNKRLNSITEPLLYSQFQHRGPTGPWLFMRTLLAKPFLSRHVKSISSWPYDTLGYDGKPSNAKTDIQEEARFSLAEWNQIEGVVRSSRPPPKDVELWLSKLRGLYYDPIITLIILQCCNLTSLHILDFPLVLYRSHYHLEEGHPFLFEICQELKEPRMQSSPEIFSKLETIELGHTSGSEEGRGVAFRSLVPFMSIPSVSSLCCHRLCDQYEEEAEFEKLRSLSAGLNLNVTELELLQVNLNVPEIEVFLSLFDNLKSLVYEEGGVTIGDADLDPRSLFQNMQRFRHSLEKFTFIHDVQYRVGAYLWEDYPIGSFANFDNLHSLHIEAHALGDYTTVPLNRKSIVRNIPPRLENLLLRHCRRETFSQIVELLDSRKDVAPFLSNICLASDELIGDEASVSRLGMLRICSALYDNAPDFVYRLGFDKVPFDYAPLQLIWKSPSAK